MILAQIFEQRTYLRHGGCRVDTVYQQHRRRRFRARHMDRE